MLDTFLSLPGRIIIEEYTRCLPLTGTSRHKRSAMFYKILTKGCTRCGGDLFLENEDDGLCLACIQCGAVENELTRLLQIRIGNRGVSEDNLWKQRKPVRVGECS